MGMGDGPEKKGDKLSGGRLGGTRPGVGIDPTRPPVRVDPGTRRLDRPVSVALAMPLAVERTAIAKALVQAQCTVTLINAAEDVGDAEVLVADFDAPDVFALVEACRRSRGDVPTVAWTSRRAMVERGLSAMGFEQVEALDRKARMSDLVEAVKRLVGA
jgi:hypothetical protein